MALPALRPGGAIREQGGMRLRHVKRAGCTGVRPSSHGLEDRDETGRRRGHRGFRFSTGPGVPVSMISTLRVGGNGLAVGRAGRLPMQGCGEPSLGRAALLMRRCREIPRLALLPHKLSTR
jgi:hypothetical protein